MGKILKKLYRIKYDHKISIGGYATVSIIIPTKKQAMKRIREDLSRFPYAKASLQASKKGGFGWKAHSSYIFRKSKKTGKVRLVKL